MIPRPIALGLHLCDQVIVEQNTRKVSIIGSFNGIAVSRFPSETKQFSAIACLTGGMRDGIIRLKAARPETDEVVYEREGQVTFPDRSVVVNALFRVRGISFPEPGRYLFTLSVDGETIAERFLRVYLG